MNQVTIIGRLGADPELKYTPSGKAVASFRVAVDGGKDRDGEKLTEWVSCEAWERTAEVVAEYARKGRQIAVQGQMRTRSWECDRCEHKHYKTELVFCRVELLGSRDDNDAGSDREPARSSSSRRSEPELDVDDIPF